MATAAVNKNKVSVLAKDLGMTSKEIVSIMKEYVDTVKGPSQVLDERELSI
ncbi:MAG: translation initiation factor IF-2 N-terminal domain-containing protein, partial [Schwartzia sp.]|nr:translation initiation factor IF-2 N-terminal domain-containing protein [Schwartzia sp. (in: firmicutes)]